MFKCDDCGRNSEKGEKQYKKYSYKPRHYTNTRFIERKKIEKNSFGFEIESETSICKNCVED